LFLTKFKCLARYSAVMIPVLLLQIAACLLFLTVWADDLYVVNDRYFFLLRYLIVSMMGIALGALCYLIPIERLNRRWSNTKSKIMLLGGVGAAFLGTWTLPWLLGDPYTRHVWHDWFHPYEAMETFGWGILYRWRIFEDALWLGETNAAMGDTAGYLRGESNGGILEYILLRTGIVPFILLLLLLAGFVAALFYCALKRTENGFGKALSLSIAIYFALNALCKLSNMFYLLPPLPRFPLALLEYNRLAIVFHLCLLGLFLRAMRDPSTVPLLAKQ